MSDELNATPAVLESPEKKPGFLSTPGGRIVAIVVGLGILGIIAGVAVAIVLYVFGSQAVDELESQIQTPGTSQTTTQTPTVTPTAVTPAGPAAEVPNADVFTFRNIFEPLLKPLAAAGAAAPGDGTAVVATDTVTPTAGNTLYLDGVVTQDGVLMAQLRYNGANYTLAPGGTIPNSPWQVLRVSTTSVTMLYGDRQVSLSVGQGITK